MKQNVRTCLLIVGATLLVAGCSKQAWEGLFSRRDGAPVVFSMTTRSDTPTRTVYGDFSDNTKTFQYIDWVAGDVIRIYSPDAVNRADFGSDVAADQKRHWSDYRVTGQQRRAVNGVSKSVATIENVNSNGLAWVRGQESVSHAFYGVYPAPVDGEGKLIDEDPMPKVLGPEEGVDAEFRFNYPAEQDFSETGVMQAAYMTAVAKEIADGADAGKVELEFNPVYTAFEVELRSAEGAGERTLNYFQLVSEAEALCGDFAIQYAGTTRSVVAPESQETNRSIRVNFPENTVIDEDTPVRFTIFALPQDFSQLKLVFNVDENVTRTLRLKYASTAVEHTSGAWITFAGFKKHRIIGLALPGGGWSASVRLDVYALDWIDGIYNDMTSEEYPESSQFTITNAINKRDGGVDGEENVSGTGTKADRQTWYFKKNVTTNAITIDFNVTSPVGGTWSIEPQGDTGSFDITWSYKKYTTTTTSTIVSSNTDGSISGTVNAGHPTKVTLTVTPKSSATSGQQIYFKTFVTNADGSVKYSLDSETQLYDMRGYHYLVIR